MRADERAVLMRALKQKKEANWFGSLMLSSGLNGFMPMPDDCIADEKLAANLYRMLRTRPQTFYQRSNQQRLK